MSKPKLLAEAQILRARIKELEGQVKTLSETLKLMQKSLACDMPEPGSAITKENHNE